jgi:thiol-disulfide isomerase/thioredoxin
MKRQFKIAIILLLIIAVTGIYYGKNIYAKKGVEAAKITSRLDEIVKVHNGELKKPVVMELATTTCPNCVEMYPIMERISEKYGDRAIIGVVYLDDKEIEEQARYLAKKYSVMYVPTMVFLDKDGKVVSRKVGAMTEQEIINILNEMGVEEIGAK